MNILIVNSYYHPFIGGVETQARLFAHELSRRGHRVEVAAVNFRESRLPKRLAMLSANLLTQRSAGYVDGAVTVHSLAPSAWDRVKMLPIAVRAIPKLQRYAYHALQRFGYPWYRAAFGPKLKRLARGMDVVHSLSFGYLGWAAQEAARDAGAAFVCTPYVHPGQWGDDADNVAFYRRSDAILPLIETDRAYLLKLGIPAGLMPRLQGVVPLLPDRGDGAGFRQRRQIGTAPMVLYVGRMMPKKGARALLDSLPRLWEAIPEARVVFIGPPEGDSDQWFANSDPRVQYLGKVSESEKADALAACDLFCMPSVSEILPAAYLEAWYYGKAVIGGKAEGLPELIEGNGGGVTVTQDPGELAAALIALLRDDARRAQLGRRGAELVRRRYSKEAVVGNLEALYQEVVAARRAGASTARTQPSAMQPSLSSSIGG